MKKIPAERRSLIGVRVDVWLFLAARCFLPAADLDPVLVGQYPPYGEGSPYAIATSGDRAYVAFGGAGLQILDIHNPSEPRLLGAYDPPGVVVDVAIEGDYAYIRLESVPGFEVLDVSTPSTPRKVGSYRSGQSGFRFVCVYGCHLALRGSSAYFLVHAESAGGDLINRIEAIDISDPERPTLVAIADVGWGLDAMIGVGGNVLCAATRHSLGASWSGTLELIDISDPARPRRSGACDLLTDPYGGSVVVSGNYAYVGGVGLTVVDISDPAHPRTVSAIEDIAPVFGSSVAVSGNLAVMGGESLVVLDVSNPTNPRKVSQLALKGGAGPVALAGHHAYVGDWGVGIQIVNLSSPDAPQPSGAYRYSFRNARAVAVSENKAYVGTSYGDLTILDVSRPVAPLDVGQCEIDGSIDRIRISGASAHLLVSWWDDTNSLTRLRYEILDVSNPADPQRTGATDVGGSSLELGLVGLAILGDHAYVASRWYEGSSQVGGLQVIDITDVTHPIRVGACITTTGGDAIDVAVTDNCACVVGVRWDDQTSTSQGYLQVLDISQPADPQRLSELSVPPSYSVAIWDRHAYVCSDDGLLVIDLSDPARPSPVGVAEGIRGERVAVSGRYACVADSYIGGGVTVIDVSDPTYPRRVGHWVSRASTRDVAMSGRYVYAADHYFKTFGLHPEGLVILDLENPACIQQIGSVPVSGGANGVAVLGSKVYLTSGGFVNLSTNLLHTVDASDPSRPRVLGKAGLRLDCDTSQMSVVSSGSYAFANGCDILNVLDVRDPAEPKRVGEVDIGGKAAAIALLGDYAYVAGSHSSYSTEEGDRARLLAFDARTLPNLQQIGSVETPGRATDLAIMGRHAYLAGENLEVIDISDPSHLRSVARCVGFGGGDYGGRIGVSTGRAYVAGDGSLRVFDVSDPTNPGRIGECAVPGVAQQIASAGDHVYLATAGAGVQVFDVRDPAHPRRVGGNSAFDAYGLAIADGRLYVAAGDQGLVILNLYQPLRLESPHLEAAGFHLLLRGAIGQMMRVERSRNLLDWEAVATVPIAAGGQGLIDPAATTETSLFYRVVSVP